MFGFLPVCLCVGVGVCGCVGLHQSSCSLMERNLLSFWFFKVSISLCGSAGGTLGLVSSQESFQQSLEYVNACNLVGNYLCRHEGEGCELRLGLCWCHLGKFLDLRISSIHVSRNSKQNDQCLPKTQARIEICPHYGIVGNDFWMYRSQYGPQEFGLTQVWHGET